MTRYGGLDGLVHAAQNGDEYAFELLVRVTYKDLYALAFRITGNSEDAYDVIQETYLRIFKFLSKFRGDSAVTTWMYRITANCSATFMASRGKSAHQLLEEDTPVVDYRPDDDPEEVVSALCERDRILLGINELPMSLRSVLILSDVYHLPHSAIAAELSITETAAKIRLHRARKLLRQKLFSDQSSRLRVRPSEYERLWRKEAKTWRAG